MGDGTAEMKSQDFIDLMTKLHDEKYKLLSNRIEYDGMGENPLLRVTVVLEKDGNQINIQSSEPDFLKYVVELRDVVDTTGEHKFTRLKDLNQYNVDLEHLVDEDRSKIKKAVEEIKSGKFKREYSPIKLIDELLGNAKNVRDMKFLPLKNDYHHILTATLLESKALLKGREALIKKYPEAKKVADGVERILMTFRSSDNALKDYKFYRNFASFDIDKLGGRMSTQLEDADDIVKEFIKREKIDAKIALPRMMNIYANFLEILNPMLNLVRIGLELIRGNKTPSKYYSLVGNIEILKSDSEFGQLFGCLDEQIRHASAHASFRIDKAAGKVYLMDERSGKDKIVRTYTFDELMNIINTMENEFFPVIYPTLVIFDIVMLDLLLVSREYKHLLLAIGNS